MVLNNFNLHLLSRGDEDICLKAVDTLVRLGDIRVIKPLVEAMEEQPNRYVAKRISEALVEFGGPEVMKHLLALVSSKSMNKRLLGVKAVAEIAENVRCKRLNVLVEPLVIALTDELQGVRAYAAVALGFLGDKRAVKGLRTALKTHDDDQRNVAAKALGVCGDESEVEDLAEVMREYWELSMFSAAIAIGKIGGDAALQALLGEFDYYNNFGLSAAMVGLHLIQDERAVAHLVELIENRPLCLVDEEDKVVCNTHFAIVALGGMGFESAAKPLVTLVLNDAEILCLRQTAAEALAKIGGGFSFAADDLIALVMDESQDEVLRAYTAKALGWAKEAKAVEPLMQLLGNIQKEMGSLGSYAAQALGMIGDKKARPLLAQRFLECGEWQYQDCEDFFDISECYGVAIALGRLGSPCVVEKLVEIYEVGSWVDQYVVVDLCANYDDVRTQGVLKRAVVNEDNELRERAEDAIQKSGYTLNREGVFGESVTLENAS